MGGWGSELMLNLGFKAKCGALIPTMPHISLLFVPDIWYLNTSDTVCFILTTLPTIIFDYPSHYYFSISSLLEILQVAMSYHRCGLATANIIPTPNNTKQSKHLKHT